MISDPLMLSQKDYKRAKKCISLISDEKIVLIGGGSGTSKSELAYAVQKELYNKKKTSFIVSLDDYYTTHATIRAENRKKQGLESVGISELDWESLKRIYEDFQNQKEIHFRRTHRFLDAIEYNTIEANFDYLIIEGLYANYLRKFYNDNFSIYLEGSPAQTLEFRKLRGKEQENDEFRQSVVQKEYNVVVQLKRYSDVQLEYEND
jgi:uridine kinase